MEAAIEDSKSLLEQVNLQEKELRHKRRWLIGLPTSQNEVGQLKGSKFQTERTLPEHLLREDDLSYETIKSFVEKGAGGCTTQIKYHMAQGNMQLLHSPRDVKDLFSLIDNMTNQGLCCFAELLTGGSVNFEKTRWKMKNVIKGCISKQSSTQQMNLPENHSSLLKNPHNFRWSSESRFIPDSKSYHTAVLKILDVLEDLPIQTLVAMNRKLRGIKGYMPQMKPTRSGWRRDALIQSLRKKCMRLLLGLGEEDSLQEPLAKAMEVAGLTLNLIQGCHYVTSFIKFSPEINALQYEIAMSAWLLDQGVKFPVLKKIQLLLDPKAKLSDRKLRTSIRNMLVEYLFECSDMDTVPECLLEVIAIIKQSSEGPYKQLSVIKIEEEVECILNLSASTKQVLWDLISEQELDLEFADAYMENLEESDGDDICEDNKLEIEPSQNHKSHSSNSDEDVGSSRAIKLVDCHSNENIGSSWEINSINYDLAVYHEVEGEYTFNSKVSNLQSKDALQYHVVSLGNMDNKTTGNLLTYHDNQDDVALDETFGQEHPHISGKHPDLISSNFSSDKESICKNQYLAVQAASDETSMVAYRLIGNMLDNFATIEGCQLKSSDMFYLGARVAQKEPTTYEEDGCSIIIKAIEELIPSFAEGGKERLKELMGSKVDCE